MCIRDSHYWGDPQQKMPKGLWLENQVSERTRRRCTTVPSGTTTLCLGGTATSCALLARRYILHVTCFTFFQLFLFHLWSSLRDLLDLSYYLQKWTKQVKILKIKLLYELKIRWKRHIKYDKLSPNKYPHTYLLLVLKQNKGETNLKT